MQEPKTGQGWMFPNERKEKDSQPDFRGSLNVGGTTTQFAGWKTVSKAGKKYISLRVDTPYEAPAPQKQQSDDWGDTW